MIGRPARGFTLMELLLVLALIAVLAGLVIPVVSNTVINARESALKENLYVMRKAIDDYYADKGAYPPSLQTLVKLRYIRKIPVDPVTERTDSWQEIQSGGEGKNPGVMDVRSGSEEKASDGTPYRDW